MFIKTNKTKSPLVTGKRSAKAKKLGQENLREPRTKTFRCNS